MPRRSRSSPPPPPTDALVALAPLFDGFPYLATRIVPGACHLTLLPPWSRGRLLALLEQQVAANQLDAALVLSADEAHYRWPGTPEVVVGPAPRATAILTGRLLTPEPCDPADLEDRPFRRSRSSRSPEAERDRGGRDNPPRPPRSTPGLPEAGLHYERGHPAPEEPDGGQGAEDRQQRVDSAERAAEEGCGVGRHRADAVHDPVAQGTEIGGRVPRLRRVRTTRRRCSGQRGDDTSRRAAGG